MQDGLVPKGIDGHPDPGAGEDVEVDVQFPQCLQQVQSLRDDRGIITEVHKFSSKPRGVMPGYLAYLLGR